MNEWENCCRINTLLLLLSMLNQKVENCLIRSKGIAFCKNRQYYHAKKFSAAAASFKETISEWMEMNSVLFDLMTLLRSEVDSLVLEEVVAQSSNSRFFLLLGPNPIFLSTILPGKNWSSSSSYEMIPEPVHAAGLSLPMGSLGNDCT